MAITGEVSGDMAGVGMAGAVLVGGALLKVGLQGLLAGLWSQLQQ